MPPVAPILPTLPRGSIPRPPLVPPVSSNKDFYILITFIIATAIFLYLIWINPNKSIVKNAKNVYQSALNTMDTTYGNPKKEAEQAAQNAQNTWNTTLTKIYKIILEALLIYTLVIFNYYQSTANIYLRLGVNLLLVSTMIFEFFSDILDNWLKSMFNDINSSASKNTQDNTGATHKTLALFISGAMCLASILGKVKYGDALFATSGIVSFILTMFTLFNANFNSTTALICFSILGILSLMAGLRYDNNIFYTVFAFSAVIAILSALQISTFDSEPYIFILFFFANIPFVTLFMNSLGLQKSKDSIIYIPLLIAFYILSIIMLTVLGAVDLSSNMNLYIILTFLGGSILYYAKSLQDSIYKTFLLVVTMIVFFFIALHYILVSQQWIVFMIAFIGIMAYIMKRTPASMGNVMKQPSKITNREIVLISGEILFVLTYIYIRSIAKKVYSKHGQIIVNNPVPLNTPTIVKVNEPNNYIYGLSFWVYIDPMNPSSSPQATEYTTILSYSDAPLITYNGSLNTMKIGIKTESRMKSVDEITSLPLQKWNHIVLNYSNGICDVFINGELHTSKANIIPFQGDKIFEIGMVDGIEGNICNVIFFQENLTGATIKEIYNEFSYKNPPTI
jgi:hypothetical protein